MRKLFMVIGIILALIAVTSAHTSAGTIYGCVKKGDLRLVSNCTECKNSENCISWNQNRFTDMGDGTIRDNDTSLIWLKDASCSELAGTDEEGKALWDIANSAAADLADGTCGLEDGSLAGDWRLATAEEWNQFMSQVYDNPAVVDTTGMKQWSEGDAFIGVQSYDYWSTERDEFSAWFATSAGNIYYKPKESFCFVWPVRSGK